VPKRINSVDIELNPKNDLSSYTIQGYLSFVARDTGQPPDSDGSGVTNVKENETEPNRMILWFYLAHQKFTPSSAMENADCDGDGVTNLSKEKQDGNRSHLDSCDLF